ncbi:MAG: TetR family transcriptional regulator [Rhodospirillales bacterium]|nr:TetR family transcriptional regulator [Rhodospirillales bacterium]
MAKRPDTEWRIIAAALELGRVEGWRSVTLTRIAEETKIPLSGVISRFPNKNSILDKFSRRIDAQVIAGADEDSSSIRDRLFDLIMLRFDALQPHKEQLRSILRQTVPLDPIAGLSGICALMRSMNMMLEFTGVSTAGPLGRLKVKALGFAYLSAARVWLGDESKNSEKTMAALDRSLARLENLAEMFLIRTDGDDAPAKSAG